MTAGRDDVGPASVANRAAEYVRMSTEHQKYSIPNQQLANRVYAAANRLEIVRTYEDASKSGLHLRHRTGLRRLIDEVQSGLADFTTILVYDVSRWGRFQDNDESAYYEHLCTRAGVKVRYCAEPFDNDGTPLSTLIKILKRAMASEYSRELSAKVFAGQARIVQLGYLQAGLPGYGLRRMLIHDQTRAPRGELLRGQRKSSSLDRVILVPGPQNEVDTVRWIFRAFAVEKKSLRAITDCLSTRGIKNAAGTPWTKDGVRVVLKNERYIGNLVYNKSSCKLSMRRTRNPPEIWIRGLGAVEPIVERELFDAVQARFRDLVRRPQDDDMLEALRRLYLKKGHLNFLTIQRARWLPRPETYRKRFGCLLNVYQIVGFVPRHCIPKRGRLYEKLGPGVRTQSESLRRYFQMG